MFSSKIPFPLLVPAILVSQNLSAPSASTT